MFLKGENTKSMYMLYNVTFPNIYLLLAIIIIAIMM